MVAIRSIIVVEPVSGNSELTGSKRTRPFHSQDPKNDQRALLRFGRIARDGVDGNRQNQSGMVPLVSFAAPPRSR